MTAHAAREPTSVHRAKEWTREVENAFRFQSAGWRSREEYLCSEYDTPAVYAENQLVASLQIKENGYYMYFTRTRECADKYLPRVKIYEYGDGKDNHK
ncbi:meiosis expressed protein 1 [Pelagophyceae sp. CCMP2097]|nr:meiosis expressed protein 1 [Pelagophyceae sp. CCMP2097]|mmetsp:Transcript_4487/g.14196  ORF Transcript_4487/g.14196 Transcript_4487/m.14196 type:complete len:98 (+) Transcript_4487:54-347(+)